MIIFIHFLKQNFPCADNIYKGINIHNNKGMDAMCKHRFVQFLGEQERHNSKKTLSLYNCCDCLSTISINNDELKSEKYILVEPEAQFAMQLAV